MYVVTSSNTAVRAPACALFVLPSASTNRSSLNTGTGLHAVLGCPVLPMYERMHLPDCQAKDMWKCTPDTTVDDNKTREPILRRSSAVGRGVLPRLVKNAASPQ